MSRAVIIAGGVVADYGFTKALLRPDDAVYCADSGYLHARAMGIVPRVVAGDFDSLGYEPAGVEIDRYPARKDLTDSEIAVALARREGHREFLLLGALGGRMDHSLTNILMLKSFLERGERAEIVNEHNRIRLTGSLLCVDEPPGSIVSLVPAARCEGVTTRGLEYPLRGACLEVGSGWGVSNIVLAEDAQVSLDSGLLLVITARD